jgi:hypothetical protein
MARQVKGIRQAREHISPAANAVKTAPVRLNIQAAAQHHQGQLMFAGFKGPGFAGSQPPNLKVDGIPAGFFWTNFNDTSGSSEFPGCTTKF